MEISSIYRLSKRFQGIMFHRSGIKQLPELLEMYGHLNSHLKYLVENNNAVNSQREANCLAQILIITIFGLFNTIEGYQDDKKFDHERLKKTIPQME